MDEIAVIKIVFGTLLTLGSMVLFLITFLLWYKYLIQERRCTSIADGVVIRYALESRGWGVHLPVVAYSVLGKEYKVKGPEYKWIRGVFRYTGFAKNTMEYQETGQSLVVNRTTSHLVRIYRNPMQELYPLHSHLCVYYDPNRPRLAYVKRYCNKKFVFWMGFGGGVLCLLIDVLILVML